MRQPPSTSSFLSSQVVSNQVLSTYECLTTVFGMGTGGSTQLSPLDFFLRSTRVSVPSKLYRRQMEHFRVMAKLHMLSTFVCLAAACGGQRQPITCALRAWFLGRFRTLAPLPIGCTPVGFASWMGYASQALGILVRVGCTPCGASTPRLSTSSSLRCLTGLLREKLHLRAGFTLRCFQRLSFPDAATQLHGWRHDWYTVGPSTPVLSY